MTRVSFKLSNPISSKTVKPGSRVSFETTHDVTVKSSLGEDLLIPQGTVATGAVEKSKKAWRVFGRQGHLQISVPTQIQDSKGNTFSLSTSKDHMESKGGGDRRFWSPLLSVFVFPLPFWIWRGKNAKIINGFQAQIHAPVQGIRKDSTVTLSDHKAENETKDWEGSRAALDPRPTYMR